MEINEIHDIYGIYLFWKKKMGYILYSKHINASHICPPKRNKLSEQSKWKFYAFRENMDFDLQITYQSHNFDENLKWSHGHYGHFARAGLTGNPDRSSVFDKSVESDFFQKYGTHFRQIIWQFDVNPPTISMNFQSGLD